MASPDANQIAEDPDRRFMNAAEVADMFGIRRSFLYIQRHRGEAPGSLGFALIPNGRRLIWDREELLAYVERQKEARDNG